MSNEYVEETIFNFCVILIANLVLKYVEAKNEGENGLVTKSLRPLDKDVRLLNKQLGHQIGHLKLGYDITVLIYIYIYVNLSRETILFVLQ